MAHRIYHWKHGWIPLDHYAALKKAHGSHKGAMRALERSHAAGHAHHSVTKAGSSSDGTHVRGLHPVAREHMSRASNIIAAHDPQTRRFALLQKAHGEGRDVSVSIPEELGDHLHARGHHLSMILDNHDGTHTLIATTKDGGVKKFRSDGSDRLAVDPEPTTPGHRKDETAPEKVRPEWSRELDALAAQLPADRNTIGIHRRELSGEEERQANIAKAIQDAGGTVEELTAKIEGAQKNLKAWRALLDAGDDHRGIYSAKTWPPELVDLVKAGGFGRRQPKTVMPALLRAIREQDNSLAKMTMRRTMLERNIYHYTHVQEFKGRVERVDDLTPEGELGDATRAALDATREAGRILDQEIAKRVAKRMGDGYDPTLQYDEVQRKIDALNEERHHLYLAGDDYGYDKLAPELAKLRDTRAQLTHRVEAWKKTRSKVYAEEARAVLSEHRAMGRSSSSGLAYVQAPRGSVAVGRERLNTPHAELERRMRAAEDVYPSDWLEHAKKMAPTVELLETRRGYNSHGQQIALSPDHAGNNHTAVHELGHSMERAVPGLSNLEWAFHYHRSSSVKRVGDGTKKRTLDPAEQLAYMPGEMAQRDQWALHYTGKRYNYGSLGADNQYEVLTTGAEALFSGSPYFDRSSLAEGLGDDTEFRHFILGALSVL